MIILLWYLKTVRFQKAYKGISPYKWRWKSRKAVIEPTRMRIRASIAKRVPRKSHCWSSFSKSSNFHKLGSHSTIFGQPTPYYPALKMHNFAWLKKWKHYVGQVNHSIFEDTSPVFRFSSGVLKALWRLLLAFGAIPSAIAFCFLDQRRDGDLTKIWLAPFGNDWNGFLYPVFFCYELERFPCRMYMIVYVHVNVYNRYIQTSAHRNDIIRGLMNLWLV